MNRILIFLAAFAVFVSCQKAQTISVVPYPNEVNINRGTFAAAGADVHYDAQIDQQSVSLISQFAQLHQHGDRLDILLLLR